MHDANVHLEKPWPRPWRNFGATASKAAELGCSISDAQDALFREAHPLYRVTPSGNTVYHVAHIPYPPEVTVDAADATEAAVATLRAQVRQRAQVSQCVREEWR